MIRRELIELIERLATLKRSVDCVCHYHRTPLPGTDFGVSVYTLCSTGEIFVEVSDDKLVRVGSFFSRHKSYSADERRKELPLVDVFEAFTLARNLTIRWSRIAVPVRRRGHDPGGGAER